MYNPLHPAKNMDLRQIVYEKIKAAIDKLSAAINPVFTKLYQQEQANNPKRSIAAKTITYIFLIIFPPNRRFRKARRNPP